MKYLFFDVEGANNYNFVSKMCTFGYVLASENFKVLSKVDVIMNPDGPFDKHILRKKMNAYPVEKYHSAPPFNYFYKSIKKILEYKDQIIVGWSIENDVKFLHDACERYHLQQIKYNFVDLQSIYMKVENLPSPPSLESACEKYNIERMTAHKSDDDAHLTMLLANELCKKLNISLYNLALRYKESCSSYDECSIHFLSKEEIEEKILRRRLVNYINQSETKKTLNHPLINVADVYCFSSTVIDKYGQELQQVVKYLKKCGAKCTTNTSKATFMVVLTDEARKTNKSDKIKYITFEKLLERTNLGIR